MTNDEIPNDESRTKFEGRMGIAKALVVGDIPSSFVL